MKKTILITIAIFMAAVAANAQLKVSSTGKVSIGTTAVSASKLSVGAAGHSNYAAYINGNSKVANGYVNANVFSPTTFSHAYVTSDIDGDALVALNHLQVKRHGSIGMTPPTFHYSISGSSMNSHFPELTTTDENSNYLANYSELVPVLVYGYQQIVDYILDRDGSSAAERLGYDAAVSDDNTDDDVEMSRPRMASRLYAGARLYQNTPNPFTAQTTIRFHLPEDAQNAYIYVFDMTGKTLKQLPVSSGMDSVTIQGYELQSGMYLYSLVINGQEIDTKRMILSK